MLLAFPPVVQSMAYLFTYISLLPDFNYDSTSSYIIFSERHKTSLFLELGRLSSQIDSALCARWRYRSSWVIISTKNVGGMPVDGMEQLTYLLTIHGMGSLLKSGTSVVCSSSTRTLWNLLLNDGSVDYVHNVCLVGVPPYY